MKQTHNYLHQEEMEKIVELLLAKEKLTEKTRINLYLPKIVVKLLDSLANNLSRGELVSSLVIKEVKKRQKLPFGMFSPLEISEKEINEISAGWEKTVNELA